MNERDQLFLNHILRAIAEIQDFTTAGRSGFMTDSKTQSTVIRQLEIIGEAVKNLSKAMTDNEPVVPWRQIAGARDRLIHAYFNVDIDAVWSMVEQDLPSLRAHVLRITPLRLFHSNPIDALIVISRSTLGRFTGSPCTGYIGPASTGV